MDNGRNGSTQSPRARNERAILQAMLDVGEDHDGVTKPEVAELVGLSQPVVADVVARSLRGIVDDKGPSKRPSRSGPAAQLLRIDRRVGWALAVDLGVSHVRVAIADLYGVIPPKGCREEFDRFRLDRNGTRVPQDPDRALELATDFAVDLLDKHNVAPNNDLMGVGIALAEPVNPKRGMRRAGMYDTATSGDPTKRNRWEGMSPTKELEERLRWTCPFLLDNDANAGARAEHRWGAAQGRSNFVHVRWTQGIGAGIYINGQLYSGHGGIAGEIGHNPIVLDTAHREEKPPKCEGCDHWCLESVAGTRAIVNDAAAKGLEVDDALGLLEKAEMDNHDGETAREVIHRAARYMGQGLASLMDTLNPEMITIGGEFPPEAYRFIIKGIREGVSKHALPPAFADVSIKSGKRTGGPGKSTSATLEGAIALVLEQQRIPFLLARGRDRQPVAAD